MDVSIYLYFVLFFILLILFITSRIGRKRRDAHPPEEGEPANTGAERPGNQDGNKA